MKVVNCEEKSKMFFGFIVGLCVIVGGMFMVVVVVDRGFFEGVMRFKKMCLKD